MSQVKWNIFGQNDFWVRFLSSLFSLRKGKSFLIWKKINCMIFGQSPTSIGLKFRKNLESKYDVVINCYLRITSRFFDIFIFFYFIHGTYKVS